MGLYKRDKPVNRRGYDTGARSFQMALHEAAEGLANRSKLTDPGSPLANITPPRECPTNLATCAVNYCYGRLCNPEFTRVVRPGIQLTSMHGSQQDPRRK